MCDNQRVLTEFYETKVKDIMQTTKSEIPCIEDNTDVSQVISSLNLKDHVWVLENKETTHLIGVITQSDTIALFSPALTSSESFDNPDPRSLQFGVILTAEEIMSKKPVIASPEENIRDILTKMKEQKIKHLPVINDQNQLIGEISLSRIIQLYLEQKKIKKEIS